MDELTVAKMKAMRETGMTYKEISMQIGVCPSTVMFHLNPSSRTKHREFNKKYYEENKDKVNERRREYGREYQGRYRTENKEYVYRYNQEYNKNNPGWNKEWTKEHSKAYQKKRLKQISSAKARCLKNKDQIKARAKEYYLENKDRINENKKIYRLKNKEKFRVLKKIAKHKRKAIKKSLEHTFTNKEWLACLNHFNNKCAYCGTEEKLTQDHFIALSKQGEYTRNNIVPVCHSCNSSKQDKDFFEWYPQQKFYSKHREQKILKFLNYTDKNQQLSLCMAVI
jgi:hypothetical protein